MEGGAARRVVRRTRTTLQPGQEGLSAKPDWSEQRRAPGGRECRERFFGYFLVATRKYLACGGEIPAFNLRRDSDTKP